MSEDLPIYAGSTLRTRIQFSELDRLKGADVAPSWNKSDSVIAQMEGAVRVREARQAASRLTKAVLLEIHSELFYDRPGAGTLRQTAIQPLHRGQDCPDPEFIDRSLDNFFGWLDAESVAQIHPIEKTALVITRIVDIWPFDFGNLTAAIVLANVLLEQAGYAPFFVRPEHMKEFNAIVAQAISIETQPLVNAIQRTVKREMESLVR